MNKLKNKIISDLKNNRDVTRREGVAFIFGYFFDYLFNAPYNCVFRCHRVWYDICSDKVIRDDEEFLYEYCNDNHVFTKEVKVEIRGRCLLDLIKNNMRIFDDALSFYAESEKKDKPCNHSL